MKFNVFYDTPEGVKEYCLCSMSFREAKKQLANFKRCYLNEDGSPKVYPNGKGYYDISNPRIQEV